MSASERWRRPLAATLAAALLGIAGCGDVEVATGVEFPEPLVEELPMAVGVYYSEEFRKYAHNEQRWGVDWKVDLGQFHVRMGDKLFESAFRETVPVEALGAAPQRDLRAIIEPRIEQYSFITPRDTGAKYYAVTIRYRLNVFTPQGQLADSLTFTGYGSAPSSGMTSTTPMIQATKAAMRDAAAKFLVQFPEQPVAKRMIGSLPLIEEAPVASSSVAGGAPATGSAGLVIETMPMKDTPPKPAEGSPANEGSEPPAESKPGETQSGETQPAPAKPGAGSSDPQTPSGEEPSAPPPGAAPPENPDVPPRSTSDEPSRWTGNGVSGSSAGTR